jgi:hypothetical protein
MDEQTVSAIIIPFPKRHRGINPSLPARMSPLSPVAPKPAASRPVVGKPTTPRPLTTEPAISGLPKSPVPTNPAPTSLAMAPLARIISDLDSALSQQNAAVARWRNAIQDLRTAIDGLDGSLKQYRDRLTRTGKGATAS